MSTGRGLFSQGEVDLVDVISFFLHLVVSGNRSTWGTPISRTLGKWCLFYQLQILQPACKEWEVRYLIRGKLAANWPGGRWLWWVICGHVGQMQWCPWYALSWRYLWSSSLRPKKHRWLKVQSELKIAEDTIASTFAQSWLWHWESVQSRWGPKGNIPTLVFWKSDASVRPGYEIFMRQVPLVGLGNCLCFWTVSSFLWS